MHIAIFQIDTTKDINCVCFTDLQFTRRFGEEIDASIYERVFEGDIDCDGLEGVYHLFNFVSHSRDPEYTGRSMSVSDVVYVEPNGELGGYYFCDTIGFKEIEFDEEKTTNAESLVNLVAKETNEAINLILEAANENVLCMPDSKHVRVIKRNKDEEWWEDIDLFEAAFSLCRQRKISFLKDEIKKAKENKTDEEKKA